MKGRPKKPSGEARKNVLRIRLTESERAALDKAANYLTLDTSTWARMKLIQIANDERR